MDDLNSARTEIEEIHKSGKFSEGIGGAIVQQIGPSCLGSLVGVTFKENCYQKDKLYYTM